MIPTPMARSKRRVREARASPWPFACALLLLVSCVCVCAAPSGNRPRRLVCWQAIFNCNAEPQCYYAYEQYTRACEPVLSGHRRSCPSHCIASLVQLNMTKNGPALEDCGCADDPLCRETKRAIEPCLPRTSSVGCTEARRQCERDSQCRSAMSDYMKHCSKLFGGVTCTSACRDVIAHMRRLPKAQLLDTCVCDGAERTICEYIKTSMQTLCFGAPPYPPEEGSGNTMYDYEDGEDDEPVQRVAVGNSGTRMLGWRVLAGLLPVLLLLLLLV